VREYCYHYQPEEKRGTLPPWWLPCYDLSTEFHLFAKDFKERCQSNHEVISSSSSSMLKDRFQPNNWIIKPCGGTRGLGHRILTHSLEDKDEEGLHHAAVFAPVLTSYQLSILLNESYDETKGETEQSRFASFMSNLLGCEYLPLDSVDRVAQLIVEHPLLLKNRKFDLRCYVFVRSFYPFEGNFFALFWCFTCSYSS
jgi:hypothetical protein